VWKQPKLKRASSISPGSKVGEPQCALSGIARAAGTLGHALSTGLGMALGARLTRKPFSVFVLLGDGELHEGQIREAAMSAAHHRAGNLVAIVDRNRFSLDGQVDDIIGLEPLTDRRAAFG
jgi:transketolase